MSVCVVCFCCCFKLLAGWVWALDEGLSLPPYKVYMRACCEPKSWLSWFWIRGWGFLNCWCVGESLWFSETRDVKPYVCFWCLFHGGCINVIGLSWSRIGCGVGGRQNWWNCFSLMQVQVVDVWWSGLVFIALWVVYSCWPVMNTGEIVGCWFAVLWGLIFNDWCEQWRGGCMNMCWWLLVVSRCVLFVMYQVLWKVLWNVFFHNMMCAVFHPCRRVFQLLNTMRTIWWRVHTIQLVQQWFLSLLVQKCIDRSGCIQFGAESLLDLWSWLWELWWCSHDCTSLNEGVLRFCKVDGIYFDCFIARSLFVLYRLFVFVLSVCEYYMLLMVLQLLLCSFHWIVLLGFCQ